MVPHQRHSNNAMLAPMRSTDQNRILVVDDDPQIRSLLRNLLETEGYTVSEAASGQEMFSLLKSEQFSLVTLDLLLPGEDGLALAREVRALSDVRIIMISGKASDIDKIVGLELGADDYITKPFNVREVLARVPAVLRRYKSPQAPTMARSSVPNKFAFGGWLLDTVARELTTPAGQRIELTGTEFELLKLF